MQRLFADTSLVSWKQSSPGEKEVHPGAGLPNNGRTRMSSCDYKTDLRKFAHCIQDFVTDERVGRFAGVRYTR